MFLFFPDRPSLPSYARKRMKFSDLNTFIKCPVYQAKCNCGRNRNSATHEVLPEDSPGTLGQPEL